METIPVAMTGRFRLLPGSQCQLSGNGLLAACMLGKGRAIIVADAAMLDDADGAVAEVATEALNTLLDRTFR